MSLLRYSRARVRTDTVPLRNNTRLLNTLRNGNFLDALPVVCELVHRFLAESGGDVGG